MRKVPKHHLTNHARLRLAERSSMTEGEFLALADTCAVLVYRADSNSQYEIVWSAKDRNGYVLVVHPLTGDVITIKCVLTRSGQPCLVLDDHKAPSTRHQGKPGVARITRAMLEKAVLAAGADLAEAQPILDVLKANEAKPRAWNYRWVLRYLCEKPGGGVTLKTRNLGKEMDVQVRPPDALVAAAQAAMKEAAGWDGRLYLVARDGLHEVGQWDLPD